jgi:hypothetical protein
MIAKKTPKQRYKNAIKGGKEPIHLYGYIKQRTSLSVMLCHRQENKKRTREPPLVGNIVQISKIKFHISQ